jgi:hypothetical protein
MDLINEKKVHYTSGPCSSCGSVALAARAVHHTGEMKLCTSCLEERYTIIDNMKANVKDQFNLARSPNLRSCFLRMLLYEGVDLDPTGWRAGLALGFELKDAGFVFHESRQILLQANAKSNIVDRLLDYVYQKKAKTSLTCEQIRKLNVICDQCPGQYRRARSENRTEICQ